MTTTEFENKKTELGIEGEGFVTTTTDVRTWTNKTTKEVEFTIPTEMWVKVWFSPRKHSNRIFVEYGETVKVSRVENGSKWLKGFKKTPSFKSLEKQSYDGVAKSVLGNRVEPDGFDQYGSPSWLLVAGVI